MPNPTSNWQDYQNQLNGPGNTWRDVGQNILGGPLAWLASATGNRDMFNQTDIGGIWKGTVENRNMTQDVYNSMTSQEWDAFSKMSAQQQDQFIQGRIKDTAGQSAQAAKDKAAQDQEAAYQKWRSDTLTKLSGFADKMNMSVDDLMRTGDAGAQLAQNTGLRAAGQQSLAAGVGGGLSNLNTQKVVQDSLNNYQMQRSQMGASALNNLQQGLGSMAHDQQAMNEYNQGLDMQMQQARAASYNQMYSQGQNQQSGLFGLAGGIIGGIYGGPGGATAGQKIGSSVGGYSYGQSNPYSPPSYTYPSAGGSSYNPNAYGGRGYGGSQ